MEAFFGPPPGAPSFAVPPQGQPVGVPSDGGIDLRSYKLKHRTLTHTKLAVKKTLTNKTRRPCMLCCEMILPPFFIMALMTGYFVDENKLVPASNTHSKDPILNPNAATGLCLDGMPAKAFGAIPPCSNDTECSAEVLPERFGVSGSVCRSYGMRGLQYSSAGLAFGFIGGRAVEIPTFDTMAPVIDKPTIEFVSEGCPEAMVLITHLNQTTQLFGHFMDPSIDRGNPACPFVWKSESAAVNYVKGVGAGKVWAVVVLNQISHETATYDYTLRMNYSDTPTTRTEYDRFAQGVGDTLSKYIGTGFITLQRTIDAYYLEVSGAVGTPSLVSMAMPTTSYHTSRFYTSAADLIPFFLSLTYMLPVSRLVSGIVEEKEQRLREGMLIMGLSKISFYASWFLSALFLMTISTIAMTAMGCFTIFSRTSPILVFASFELFAMSIIAASLLLSVFFSKARIAAVISPLFTFAMTLPPIKDADHQTKMLASLLSPKAFGQAIELFGEYERLETGSGLSEMFENDYSYADAFMMMSIDIVLYLALAWYLDAVWPSQYGIRHHPLFFLFPSYWGIGEGGKYGVHSGASAGSPATPPRYVDTTGSPTGLQEAVRITGLRMEFPCDWSTAKTVAVDNLGSGVPPGAPGGPDALSFYEGQVQCVLGHNGAGKTTLINMLTGMLSPTSGDCTIWGKSIRTDMEAIRESIGLCPQHNILWPRLSCEEHLTFYGSLKGVPSAELKDRVNRMLLLVNLFEKRDAWSEHLSGGQKRKLSVACSLIGGSKLVFLDEPTAGMDVESRRAMWGLLRNPSVLEGRAIVLTTHYMEEADILGDSVAIMHDGGLHSWGSPFYLKSRLGVGYNMSVAMRSGCDPESVEEVVRRHVSRAEVSRMSCTGNELHMRIPVDSRPEPEYIREAEDVTGKRYDGNPAKLRDTLMRLLEDGPAVQQGVVPHPGMGTAPPQAAGLDLMMLELEGGAGVPGYPQTHAAPPGRLSDADRVKVDRVLQRLRTVACFPEMLAELDARKDTLLIEGYGIGMSTLEEVFLRIAAEEGGGGGGGGGGGVAAPATRSGEDARGGVVSGDADLLGGPGGFTELVNEEDVELSVVLGDDEDVDAGSGLQQQKNQQQPQGVEVKVESTFADLYTITDESDPPTSGLSLYSSQLKALLWKRFRCGLRDRRTICFQYIIPVVCIILAIAAGTIGPPKQPSLVLDAGGLGKGGHGLIYTANASTEAMFDEAYFPGFTLTNATALDSSVVGYRNMSDYLFDTIKSRLRSDNRQVAASMGGPHSVLLSNVSYYHSLPIGVNALADAHLKMAKPEGSLRTRNYPLPLSNDEAEQVDAVQKIISGIVIMIPFTLIPSSFVSFIVKERECRAKHVQIVSGAHLAAYWGASYIFDLISFLGTMVLVFAVFFGFDRTEFIGDSDVFWATFLLLLLYGMSAIGCSYVMSFFFHSHTAAQNAVSGVNFLTGFVMVIVTSILYFIESAKKANDIIRAICRVVPSFCLGEGLINLSSRMLFVAFDDELIESPFALDVIGYDLIYLACTTPFFLFLVYLLESPRIRAFVSGKAAKTASLCAASPAEEQLLPDGSPPNPAYDPLEYATLPRDGPNVQYRRGAWLKCSSPDGTTYFFNEQTGESRFGDRNTPFHRDPEVQRHEAEILATEKGRPTDHVTVKHLRKVYSGRGSGRAKVAVADLSFGVAKGELFAFLGTNGAGKTTTLSVLSGEVLPTSGTAYVAGHDVVQEAQLAREQQGFCPQFDALLDHLTCEEHLNLFASLRGVPPHRAEASKLLLLNGLGLAPHRWKLASKLSGGNRRKLSVALALMGGPSAIFLDEPSAGMDPVARRSLWGALEKAITELNLSVILTTHHLEEIEGLSRLNHRVTIMVDGRLQCLGPLSQLKQQLGDSYELTVKVASAAAEEASKRAVQAKWPGATLSETAQLRMIFHVPKLQATLPLMFKFIEDGRSELGITDYSINEMSLEQVFLCVSGRALRDEDAVAYSQGSLQRVYVPTPPVVSVPLA